MKTLKDWTKAALGRFGYDLRRRQPPSSPQRPLGSLEPLLEDLKARGLACTICLDIGASDGSWSRSLKKVFPKARCLLMEPREECRLSLERFCAEFPDCRYLPLGAGARAEERALTCWQTAATMLQESVERKDVTTERVRIVPCDSLFAGGDELPQLVKLDVEGFELEVLKGCSRLFGATEAFIIEVGLFPFGTRRPLLNDVVAFMTERDYLLYDIAGFIRRPSDGALGLVDLLFARQQGLLRADPDRW